MTHESKNVIATCKECGGRIWLDIPEKHKCEDWRGGPMDNRERALHELIACVEALLKWKDVGGSLRITDGSTRQLKLVEQALGEARAAIEGEPHNEEECGWRETAEEWKGSTLKW